MSSMTYTICDDLERELDEVARERNASPSEVIDGALRTCLSELRQEPTSREANEFVSFWMPVVPEEDDHGKPDVSINHDHDLAEDRYRHKLGRR